MSAEVGETGHERFGALREVLHTVGPLDASALADALRRADAPDPRRYAWSLLARREDGERVWGWPMPCADEVPLIVSELEWCGPNALAHLGAAPLLMSGRRWGQVVALDWEGDVSAPLRLWMCAVAEQLITHKKLAIPALWDALRAQRRVLWMLREPGDLEPVRAQLLPIIDALAHEPFLCAAVLSVFWATHPDVVLGARKLVECVETLTLKPDLDGLHGALTRWATIRAPGHARMAR